MGKLQEIDRELEAAKLIKQIHKKGGEPIDGPFPKRQPRIERTIREPLSIAKTIGKLARLNREINSHTLPKIIKRIREGKNGEPEVRRLLAEFCRRASEVREQFPHSETPTLIEFIAARFDLFLSGEEPDLSRAFGLKRHTRGRKAKSKTKRREEFIAVQVLEQMRTGKTLDEAAEIVAQAEHIHDSTARNFYSRNKEAAESLLLYRYLLAPDFGRVNSDN